MEKQITMTEDELKDFIHGAVKAELEEKDSLNIGVTKSSAYIYKDLLTEYIKYYGKLSESAGVRLAWKEWEIVRNLVSKAMGVRYVRDIKNPDVAIELARNILDVLVEHHEKMKGVEE